MENFFCIFAMCWGNFHLASASFDLSFTLNQYDKAYENKEFNHVNSNCISDDGIFQCLSAIQQ